MTEQELQAIGSELAELREQDETSELSECDRRTLLCDAEMLLAEVNRLRQERTATLQLLKSVAVCAENDGFVITPDGLRNLAATIEVGNHALLGARHASPAT